MVFQARQDIALKPNAERRKLLLAFLAYAALSIALFRYGTDFLDEGLTYQQPLRILKGELPYSDFLMIQAPGTFYLQALLIKIFGMNVLVGRIFKQLEGALVSFLTYLVIRRTLRNERAALAALVLSIAWSSALHIRYHWYTSDAAILILAGSYFFTRFIETDAVAALVFSGLSLGASVLFKQHMGLAAVLAGVLLTAICGSVRKKKNVVKRLSVFAAAALIPTAVFLACYIRCGGDLHKLYSQMADYPLRMYGYKSFAEPLFYPFKVFSLMYKQDIRYVIGVIALTVVSSLILAKRSTRPARIAGAILLAGVILCEPGIFARFSVWTAVFILACAVTTAAARDVMKNRCDRLSLCRFSLSAFAAVNLYSGTINGAGLGRFVEIMAGSFCIYGVAADMIEKNGAVRALWDKWVAVGQRRFINAGTSLYAVFGLALIIQNASFTPELDFPLYRLNRELRSEGARGVIGESAYVLETDAVVRYAKNLLRVDEKAKGEIFVYPVNSMLYPLIGASNPTSYDTLQTIPFIPEFIPDLMRELKADLPAVVIMQKTATPTKGPLEDERVWVGRAATDAVRKFLAGSYRKVFETDRYYEVYSLSRNSFQ